MIQWYGRTECGLRWCWRRPPCRCPDSQSHQRASLAPEIHHHTRHRLEKTTPAIIKILLWLANTLIHISDISLQQDKTDYPHISMDFASIFFNYIIYSFYLRVIHNNYDIFSCTQVICILQEIFTIKAFCTCVALINFISIIFIYCVVFYMN